MSIKRPPSEPSYFVSSILKPVRLFFGIGVGEGPGVSLKDGFLEPYTAQVFESVSERCVVLYMTFYPFTLSLMLYSYSLDISTI